MTRELLIEDHKSVLAARNYCHISISYLLLLSCLTKLIRMLLSIDQEQLTGITTQNKKLLDENRILQSDSDRLKRNLLIITEHLSHQAAELESSHAQLKKLQEEREADKSKHMECEKRYALKKFGKFWDSGYVVNFCTQLSSYYSVNKLSSDLQNANLTLEASREEISRLVSACMEKDKRYVIMSRFYWLYTWSLCQGS